MAEIANENMQIFGRKIFFVCSTFTLNTNIILRLMEQEYEVYKIDEPRQLRNLLKKIPDSIVYINADSHHQPQVWYNIISSFENDPEYDSCDFGVFSAKLKGSVRIRFEQGLKLKAGFFLSTRIWRNNEQRNYKTRFDERKRFKKICPLKMCRRKICRSLLYQQKHDVQNEFC